MMRRSCTAAKNSACLPRLEKAPNAATKTQHSSKQTSFKKKQRKREMKICLLEPQGRGDHLEGDDTEITLDIPVYVLGKGFVTGAQKLLENMTKTQLSGSVA